MTLDNAFFFAFMVLMAALWAALIIKRVFRALPYFFSMLCFNLGVGLVGLLVERYLPGWYLRLILVTIVGNTLLFFCVLVELGKNVLRCNPASVPQRPSAVLLFVSALLLAYFVTGQTVLPNHSLISNVYVVTGWSAEVLEFAGFLALVWWSTAGNLEWPEREFQIVTGLGVSSFESFVVAVLHTWWADGAAYHKVDQAGQAVDLLVYAYWLHYFWIEAKMEAASQPAHARIPGKRGLKSGTDPLRLGPAGTTYTAAPNTETE